MKYIVDYNDSKTSFFNIDNILREYNEIILEGKFGDWLINAPKVRKMQEKANSERLSAVRLEAKQRQDIDAAESSGKKIDKARMWKLLQDKLDAHEDMAKEYEDEANILAGTNQYLMKVRRVSRLKGIIKANGEKIRISSSEEKRELSKKNKELQKIVNDETKLINDKIKEDKDKMAEEKRKGRDKGKKDDSYNDYFQAKKAEQNRK